jgi:branched-chain amino acid transport system ATP-binding protein
MSATSMESGRTTASAGGAVPALEIVHLNKFFGGLPATQDVCLTVMPGDRRLLIGPNGAGKTTLFNQITGDLRSTSGEIRLFGRDVSRMRPDQRAHLGISRTYQIITLFPKNTILHNVCLGLLGLSSARWNLLRPLSREPDLHAQARAVLQGVALDHLADARVSEIAYGEKRRVEIALALAQKPKVLLLDEPLAGLSGPERRTVKALISAIPAETTMVLIEHDMDTALDLAHSVTLLHYGRIIVDGSREDVIADPRTREVYLGH